MINCRCIQRKSCARVRTHNLQFSRAYSPIRERCSTNQTAFGRIGWLLVCRMFNCHNNNGVVKITCSTKLQMELTSIVHERQGKQERVERETADVNQLREQKERAKTGDQVVIDVSSE